MKFEPSCSFCTNGDMDTTDKVAFCNCCEDHCFFVPYDDYKEFFEEDYD